MRNTRTASRWSRSRGGGDPSREGVPAVSMKQSRRLASPEPSPLENAPSGGRSRILVVDDQESSRRAIQRMLESLGHATEPAGGGIEALAKLNLDIDLVLLDARMPNMDGFEVAERIRENPEYLDLPIIMVTGLDSRKDRLRAVTAGINDFISKPVDTAELQVRTRSLLRLKQAHDQIKRHETELEQTVERRTRDLRAAVDAMVVAEQETHEAHLDTIRRLVLAAAM